MPATVCAVIVTFNRKALLRECLQAVLGQTRRPDTVLVVDNHSEDGTPGMVRAEFGDAVDLLELPQNEGSSGGFHAGVTEAVRRGSDWLWLMDDDTIPAEPALERLLLARDPPDGLPEPVMLTSRVVWTDGRVHPMNSPAPNLMDIDRFVDGIERNLVPIRASTFPSLLVRRDAVERHGAPRKGFWIWSDDIDFTQRILRDEPGYLVADSVAVHKTKTPHSPWQGKAQFYYAVRNGLFVLRGDTLRAKEKVGWGLLVAEQTRMFLLLERFRPWALRVVARGAWHGLTKPLP